VQSQRQLRRGRQKDKVQEFGSLTAVEEDRGLFGCLEAVSGTMVEVLDDLLKVLARGAKCVSLSSEQSD
jgi:hypothetical protein